MSTMIHADGRKTVVRSSEVRQAEKADFLRGSLSDAEIDALTPRWQEQEIRDHMAEHGRQVAWSNAMKAQGRPVEIEPLTRREAAVLEELRATGAPWAYVKPNTHPNRSTRLLPSPAPDEIRAARAAAGHSQHAAAATIGASFRAWQQWEAGERPMPAGLYQLYMLLTEQTTVAKARRALTAPASAGA